MRTAKRNSLAQCRLWAPFAHLRVSTSDLGAALRYLGEA